MNLTLLTAALALSSAAALEIRGVSPHDLIGALQLPWLATHCDGCQPDYCYPMHAPPDHACYRGGYPKCCTKDKGNCPANNKPDCECSGSCGGDTETRNEKCTSGDNTCKGTTYCQYDEGSCSGDGRCNEMPELCDDDVNEVCGCNGVTYSNACKAHAVGISVDYRGKCGAPVDEECVDLGEAAAEYIVLEHFCAPDSGTYSSNSDGYNKKCKKTAYDVCEDDIADVAGRWCPNKNLKTGKLEKLQDKCETQVDDMVAPVETNDCTLDGDECAADEFCAADAGQCLLRMVGVPGTCQPLRDMCQMSYGPVCGCDGETYSNADCAKAVGANVAHAGECERVSCTYYAVDDDTCSGNSQFCRIPEGDCMYRSATRPGYCGIKPIMCPTLYQPVCGCDSKTYANECVARSEGVNVMENGEC